MAQTFSPRVPSCVCDLCDLFLFASVDALVENNFEAFSDSGEREKESGLVAGKRRKRRNASDLFIFIYRSLDSEAQRTRGTRRRIGEWKWAYKWPADKLDTS